MFHLALYECVGMYYDKKKKEDGLQNEGAQKVLYPDGRKKK